MMPNATPKTNLLLNKQPTINNNMMMSKLTPNGPMIIRNIRNQQINTLPPNMQQRPQVIDENLNLFLLELATDNVNL